MQLSRLERVRKKSKRKIAKRQIEALDFTVYKRHIYKRYIHTPHLEWLDRELEHVVHFVETGGKSGTWMLIVEMPPRHGKTLTVSRLFPTWFLGRNDESRVMLVSYGATLAYKNSRAARAIMQSPKYINLFGLELAHGSRAVDAWDLDEYEGGADALGVLGGATGKGAHILIGDDLIKNREEAESETMRDKTWDALNDDLLTRLEPGGAVVLFATRWHMDDPIGRMITATEDPKKCNGPVVRLTFPALAKEDDVLGRLPGEALWSERFPASVLRATQARIGRYSWSALYDQEPMPAEGGLFKRANFKPVPYVMDGELEYAVRFWDLAMSAKTSADYTVGVKMGIGLDGRTKILDVQRRQLEWDDVPNFMAEVALQDGPNVPIGFEEKGYMSRAGQRLATDQRLHLYAIYGYPKDTDKFTNALPFASRVGLGMVDMVEASWNADYLDELCSFPLAAHDDQVDASAGAYEMLGDETVQMGVLNYAPAPGISSSSY